MLQSRKIVSMPIFEHEIGIDLESGENTFNTYASTLFVYICTQRMCWMFVRIICSNFDFKYEMTRKLLLIIRLTCYIQQFIVECSFLWTIETVIQTNPYVNVCVHIQKRRSHVFWLESETSMGQMNNHMNHQIESCACIFSC